MTTNNNNHIITNEIVLEKQLLLAYVAFLSLSKVLIAFNISPSHSNIN